MVLSFGEILLRLAPDEDSAWLKKNNLDVYAGGSELNVATALAKWRMPVSYCTAVPQNFLAAQLIKKVESQHIDTSTIIYTGKKIGLYYLLKGKDIQHAETVYDRAHSSFYDLKPGIINWQKVLEGIRWFHFSAISPALNSNLVEVCEEALQACAKKSITVSIDLNYRPALWQYEKTAREIMPQLLKYCDVVMGNIWAAETMLGIYVPANIKELNTKDIYIAQAKKTAEEIIGRFPKCQVVANTFRFHSTSLEYFATVMGNQNFYTSATYVTDKIVDRVGSGDCFMAGLIYGIYNHLPFQQIINFAAGAAFQKFFTVGDSTDKTVEEIKSFILHNH